MTFVTKPAPRPANITFGELLDGVDQYLRHLGISTGRRTFEPMRGDSWGDVHPAEEE